MQKKEEEKREGGLAFPALPLLVGVGLSFCLCFLLLLGVAAGIWTGALPAAGAGPCVLACVGICTLIGGRRAVKQGNRPMLIGGLSGVLVCVLLLVIGLAMTGTVHFSRSLMVLLLTALSGGVLAGLFGPGKGRKKKGEKKKK